MSAQSAVQNTKTLVELVSESSDEILKLINDIQEVSKMDDITSANKVDIANSSFSLLSKTNTIITDILKGSIVNNELLDPISSMVETLLSTAKNITGLINSDNPSDIADTSVAIVGDVNELINTISALANSNTPLGTAIYNTIKSSLDQIKENATNIASINTNSQDGKAQIANASFDLIDKINTMVSNALKEAGIGQDIPELASNLTTSLLNTAKGITNLISLDLNDKEAIASASVDLVGNSNETLNSILKLAKLDTALSDAAYSAIIDSLGNIKTTAVNLATIDTNTTEGKAQIASNSFTLIGQTGKIIISMLQSSKLDTNLVTSLGNTIDSLLDTAKSVTGLVGNHSGEEIAGTSVDLVGNINSLISNISTLADTNTNIQNTAHQAISSNLESIKQIALEIAKFDSSNDKVGIAKASFDLLNQGNQIISDILSGLNIQNQTAINAVKFTTSILNTAKGVTDLITSNDNVEIADNSVDLVSLTNDMLFNVMNIANVDNKISNAIHNSIANSLEDIKISATKLATTDATDTTNIALNSIDLVDKTKDIVVNIVSELKQDNTNTALFSNLATSVFNTTKGIINLISTDDPQAIAQASVDLVGFSNETANNILLLFKADSALSNALHESIAGSLQDIKATAENIASLNPQNDKAQITKASFDLLSQSAKIITDTLQKANINPQSAKLAGELTNSILSTAKNVTDLVTSNTDKAQIAKASVDLVGNANDILANILSISKSENTLTNAIHDSVSNSLDDIKDTAVNLAQIDSATSDGKTAIAVNSLTLISQSSAIIAQILKGANLNTSVSDSVFNLSNNLLNTAKTITLLTTIDPNSSDGKTAIASASTALVGHANELLNDITLLSNSGNILSTSVYNALKENLSKIEATAIELANADATTSEGKGAIAIGSFTLIGQTNDIIAQILNDANLSTQASQSINKLTDSVLQTAKTLTNLVQIDSSTTDGKLAIVNGSFELAKVANTIVSDVLHAVGEDSALSDQISQTAGKIIGISQARLTQIGKEIISLIEADPNTKEGTLKIVNGSLGIINETGGFVTDVISSVKENANVESSQILTSKLIDIGRSIATLIQTDPNTTEGQVLIASNSIKLIGDTNGLVSNILSLAEAATPISELVTSSVDGVLGSISKLVGSALSLKDWSHMSQGEQVAAGFDVGLKALSAAAIGVSTVGEALEKFLNTTSIIPEIGAVTSAAALVVSPLEIKGLVDEHSNVKKIAALGEESKANGYNGDALLADLLKEKFTLNAAYAATNMALDITATAVSTAAAASVVGAPIAAIVGLVKGVISGILSAVKQPALEVIANRYANEIKDYGDVSEYFKLNTKATLDKFYSQDPVKKYFDAIQKGYGADSVISLDGISTSKTSLQLAATTKLSEQINKSNNYATLLRNGEIDEAGTVKYLNMNQKTGVLDIKVPGNSVINFNTPLFAPGSEEAKRTKEGKNNYYTNLIINGPKSHTINDGDGDNIFISNDKYVSALYNTSGELIKKIVLNINAGGGNDTYIADDGYTNFNGGSGIDSISYNNSHIHGISLNASENGTYTVLKNVIDADVTVEKITPTTTQYGKRTEKVDYRELSVEKKSYEASDLLKNVEIISASDYDDYLNGGSDNDYFLGQKGNDNISGNGGDDILYGGEGNDKIYGGEGNDKLSGGSGNDLVLGGNGDDLFIQDDSLGSDILSGGNGRDTLDLSALKIKGEFIEIFKDELNTINANSSDYNIVSEVQTSGQASISTSTKWGVASTGKGGDKFLFVDGATDSNKAIYSTNINLQAGEEYKFNFMATQNDGAKFGLFIDGNQIGAFTAASVKTWAEHSMSFVSDLNGVHKISLHALSTSANSNDFAIDDISILKSQNVGVTANLGSGTLIKGNVQDQIMDFENIIGTSGNDTIYGNFENNVIVGGNGDDTIYGGNGDDVIYGGTGTNNLYGGNGNDIYSISLNSINHINDTVGTNILKLSSQNQKLSLVFNRDEQSKEASFSILKDGNKLGSTTIASADKFGIVNLDDSYYLDLENGSFKYVLSGESAKADLVNHSLNFNTGDNLFIYAAAKQNNISLDNSHTNLINIYGDTQTSISGFALGKDKLMISQLSSKLDSSTEVSFSGYDVQGADVNINLGNTHITLLGAGNAEYAGKNADDLSKIYMV